MLADSMPFYFCLALYGSIFAVSIFLMLVLLIITLVKRISRPSKPKLRIVRTDIRRKK